MLLITDKNLDGAFDWKERVGDAYIYISGSDYTTLRKGSHLLVLYGTPALFIGDFSEKGLEELGGNFVLIKAGENDLEVYSDAFGIRDIFYATDRFFISDYIHYYKLLNPNFGLDYGAVAEFIFTSTTFNFKTVLKNVKRLPPQSKLCYGSKFKVKPNTFLRYEDKIVDIGYGADSLAHAIKRAAVDIGGKADYLLLSSGLDSRAILAAHPNFECLTGAPKNREKFPSYRLADQLTEIYGLKHHLIEYDAQSYLSFAREESIRSNCRTTFKHRHFKKLRKGRIAHGLLFDTLMKGLARESLLQTLIPHESCRAIERRERDVVGYLSRFFTGSGGLINKGMSYDELQKKFPEFVDDLREEIKKELDNYARITTNPQNLMDFVWASNQIQLALDNFLEEDKNYASSFVAMHPDIIKWHFSVAPHLRFGNRLLIKSIKKIDAKALSARKENYLFRPTESKVIDCVSHMLRYTFLREYSWVPPREFLFTPGGNKMIKDLYDAYQEFVPIPQIKDASSKSSLIRENLLNYLLWVDHMKRGKT